MYKNAITITTVQWSLFLKIDRIYDTDIQCYTMFSRCFIDVSGAWFANALVLAFLGHVLGIRPRSQRAHLHDQSLSWRLSEKILFEPNRHINNTSMTHQWHINDTSMTHLNTSVHIVHSSTRETSQTLKIWSLVISPDNYSSNMCGNASNYQLPQYLPQLVLLLAFENE